MNILMKPLAGALTALGKLVKRTSALERERQIRVTAQYGMLTATTGYETETLAYTISSDYEGVDFDVWLDFDAFRNAVKGIRNLNAEISWDGEALSVGEMKLTGEKADFVRPFTCAADAEEHSLPEGFVRSLDSVASVVDRKTPRIMLRGIHIDSEGLVATDGKMLMHEPMKLDGLDGVIVPFPAALLATKSTGAGTLHTWNEGETECFEIATGNWVWSGRQVPGHYPNWRAVVPGRSEFGLEIPQESASRLSELLRQCNKPDEPVHLNQVEFRLIVGTAGQIVPMEATFTGEERFHLVIAGNILKNILDHGFNRIDGTASTAPFTARGSGGSFMVAMPMRGVNEAVPERKPVDDVPEARPEPEGNESKPVTYEEVEVDNNRIEVVERKAVKPSVPAVENANPMEALLDNINAMKDKLRTALDDVNALGRMAKDAVRANQQRDRNYANLASLVERLKTAI